MSVPRAVRPVRYRTRRFCRLPSARLCGNLRACPHHPPQRAAVSSAAPQPSLPAQRWVPWLPPALGPKPTVAPPVCCVCITSTPPRVACFLFSRREVVCRGCWHSCSISSAISGPDMNTRSIMGCSICCTRWRSLWTAPPSSKSSAVTVRRPPMNSCAAARRSPAWPNGACIWKAVRSTFAWLASACGKCAMPVGVCSGAG